MFKACLYFFALILFAFFSSEIDQFIADYFYAWGKSQGTRFMDHPLTDAIYDYGLIPSKVVAYGGLFVFLGTFTPYLSINRRRPALYLALTLLIGSGVIVNGLLKEHWGRPRPKEVTLYGGKEEFAPFYIPRFNTEEKDKSFPSGHATCGFYFVCLYYLGKKLNKKWLAVLGVFLTLLLGGALSLTRIAQGGHFFSDTLFSFLVMWATARLLAAYLFKPIELLSFAKK